IPPSLSFIIYGSVTGVSVGQLFMAGVMPGVILLAAFMVVATLMPTGQAVRLGPAADLPLEPEKMRSPPRSSVINILPLVLLIGWVLGSIYMGWATPSESAASGCLGAIVLALLLRRLSVKTFVTTLEATVRVSTPLLFLLAAAALFSTALSRSGMLRDISDWILVDLGLGPVEIVVATVLFYILLGMFMDGISMMVVTLPLTFPVIEAAGFDGVWFGVVVTLLVEIGLITPPVGLNLFVIAGAAEQPVERSFVGVIP
ncbi:TRAP transporter large permease subunit, partial [Georgenia sp. 10Sc9-8]|nr:TRAP transporter large permease subunit [Georgenia halotolerans]